MARRKGINSRKRYIQRKKKVGHSIKKGYPTLLLILLGMALVYGLYHSRIITMEKISGRINGSRLFAVRSIAVKGTQHTDRDTILAECNLSENSGIFTVNSAVVSARLAQNPWIEQVRCIKRFWGKIIIEITERVPVALLHSGSILLVDRHGITMPLQAGKSYNLPLLSGLPTVTDKKGTVVVDSVSMTRACIFLDSIRCNDPSLLQIVPQFDMSRKSCVHATVVTPPTILEMDYVINGEQLKNVQYMLAALSSRTGVPERVNVQYQNLAYVTMKLGRGKEHAN